MKGPWHSRDLPAVVWPAAITSGALVAQHVAGKATRDTLFLTNFFILVKSAKKIVGRIASGGR